MAEMLHGLKLPFTHSTPTTRVAGWLAGVFLICFVYFLPRPYDWNAQARLDMTLAIVNQGTIAIDPYHWNSQDEAFYHGHYYSNKAPGQSLAGVPLYAAHKALLQLAGSTALDDLATPTASGDVSQYFILIEYLESIYTVAIPAVLLLLLFFWFLGFFSTSLANRTLLTIALGLGTVVSPYAQVFYSHVPTAALLFAGFVLIYLLAHPDLTRGSGYPAAWLVAHPRMTAGLAGFALGAAVLFEYPACLIGGLIGIYAALHLPRRLLLLVAAGAVPLLLGLLAYDYAAYGNPLTTGYSGYAVSFWQSKPGGTTASGWSLNPKAIEGLSFKPYRGLFFLSPWLLLAFPGYLLWARQKGRVFSATPKPSAGYPGTAHPEGTRPAEAGTPRGYLALRRPGPHASRRGDLDWLLFLVIPIVFFMESAMFSGWTGGHAVGPRYLIPMLPFLALPVIFVLDRVSSLPVRLGMYGLVAISVAAVWIETLGGTSVTYPLAWIDNPLFTYSLPGLARGDLPNNLGSALLGPLFGDSAMVALLPFAALLAGISLAVWAPLLLARFQRPAHHGFALESPTHDHPHA